MPAGALLCQTSARLFVLLQQSRPACQHSRFPHRRGSRTAREKCQVQQLFHCFSQKWPSLFFLSHFSLSFRPAPKSGSDLSDDPSCALDETVSLEETAREENSQNNKLSAPFHTPLPIPAPRIMPSPERVRTQAYLPPELPPCGDACMSIPAVSDDGVIHVMTLQAGM